MEVMILANTKEQQLAIDKEGSNIIVSAGAGSGKTAVLTQRVIRKIKDGCHVNRLLVLTFTNEAANEMKSRIRKSIIKENLMDELILLDSSYITTFDSYALSLVKKYSYILNITSDISIVDENIITILKYKELDSIFESMYGDSEFDTLVKDFCLKDDLNLKQDIIRLSNKLNLLIDKDKYLDNYFDIYNDTFLNNVVSKYERLIRDNVLELQGIYNELQKYISFDLVKKLDDYFSVLFNAHCYEEYLPILSLSLPRFVGVDELGLCYKEELKSKIDDIKKLLKYDSNLDMVNSIKDTFKYINVIIKIIRELDKRICEYKYNNNSFEFNDIALMAIKIVKDNEDIREEIKEYFNEIMIDEYQDTSDIQEEFIKLIENNNVYMVGDIKQSIYRFRNANPYIFQKKYNEYAKNNGGYKIDLLKNFRSRSETLFNINEIFNLIMDDEVGNANYLEEHNMVYGNVDYDLEDTGVDNNLEIYNYTMNEDDVCSKEEKELFIVSRDINDKILNKYKVFDKEKRILRPIEYSDICIITDRNKYLEMYKKILEYSNIPSSIYMDLTLTTDSVVLVIKNLIHLVYQVNSKIYDDRFKYNFVSVARSFIFGYDDDKIYQIISGKKIYDDDIISLCKSIDINLPLERVINDILEVFNVYIKLTNLYDIDENIIRITNLVNIANNLSNLGYSMLDFINYLDEVDNKGLEVKYSINNKGSNAVKIMNIHKSKGLEFSLCYFVGMHNQFAIKELNDKMLFNKEYGVILPSLRNNELDDTILKALYKRDFYLEEISEKIRLFYVMLTRCREKMIIVTSLNKDMDSYNRLVPKEKRMKYRSFLDILDSISVIDKYVKDVFCECEKDYDNIRLKEIENDKTNIVIQERVNKINYQIINNKHFSKETNKILDMDTIKKMETGTRIHEELEYASFDDDSNKYIKNLFDNKKISRDYINKYSEYEFIYEKDNMVYNGVIDLMLEYDNYINIIDYKLKNISDDNYIKQLNGYKEYIESISNKKVYIYLYSLVDNILEEL